MRALANYRRTSIESAPNEELVVLLLEKAVSNLEEVQVAIEEGNRPVWIERLNRTRAIYVELMAAFDPAAPADVAKSTIDTYRWLIVHIGEVSRHGDLVRLQRVREVAQTVCDTWSQALRIYREGDLQGAG